MLRKLRYTSSLLNSRHIKVIFLQSAHSIVLTRVISYVMIINSKLNQEILTSRVKEVPTVCTERYLHKIGFLEYARRLIKTIVSN